MKVKLSRPLDFLVVADHSDNMGFFSKLYAGDPEYLKDETGKIWYEKIHQGGDQAVSVASEIIDRFSTNTFPPALESKPGNKTYRDAWEQTVNAAENTMTPVNLLLLLVMNGPQTLVEITFTGLLYIKTTVKKRSRWNHTQCYPPKEVMTLKTFGNG